MKDIKTRDIKKDIKVIYKSWIAAEHMKNAAIQAKAKTEQDVSVNTLQAIMPPIIQSKQSCILKIRQFMSLIGRGKKGWRNPNRIFQRREIISVTEKITVISIQNPKIAVVQNQARIRFQS